MKLKKISLAILLAAVIQPCYAARSQYVSGSITDGVYYKVGGGSVGTSFTSKRPLTIGLGFKWNSNLICGNFDMKSTISNQLNGVTEGFNQIMGSVVSNATSAVASLPALIIQRANPQLYDLLTNGVLQGKLDFSDLMTNCKQMANKMADYAEDAGIVEAAKAENLSNMLTSKIDAIRANKLLEDEGGANGITWINGVKNGGRGQDPINVTIDTAKAGYNLLNNRNVLDSSSINPNSCSGSICAVWTSPADASKWIVDVVGNQTLVTDDTSNGSTAGTPGRGLNPIIQETYDDYYEKLVDLINGTKPINKVTLAELNGQGGAITVTRGIIESLQQDDEKEILARNLAHEMALANTMNNSLMARRILLAGRKEPNIAKNGSARDLLQKQIDELDTEINQIKLEYEMKKTISGNTAMLIVERNQNRQKGMMIPISPNTNQNIINNNN